MLNNIFTLITLLYIILTPILLENYIYKNSDIVAFSIIHFSYIFMFYTFSYYLLKHINNIYSQKNTILYYNKYYIIKNKLLFTNILNNVLYTNIYLYYTLNKMYNFINIKNKFPLLWNISICNFCLYFLYIYVFFEYYAYIQTLNNKKSVIIDFFILSSSIVVYFYLSYYQKIDVIKMFLNTALWILLNITIFLNCKFYNIVKYLMIPCSCTIPILLYYDVINYEEFVIIYSGLILLLFIIYTIIKYKIRYYEYYY